jgi:hypothetical protein
VSEQAFPPPGITQIEWAHMSTSERAAAMYSGEPGSFEHLDDVRQLRAE